MWKHTPLLQIKTRFIEQFYEWNQQAKIEIYANWNLGVIYVNLQHRTLNIQWYKGTLLCSGILRIVEKKKQQQQKDDSALCTYCTLRCTYDDIQYTLTDRRTRATSVHDRILLLFLCFFPFYRFFPRFSLSVCLLCKSRSLLRGSFLLVVLHFIWISVLLMQTESLYWGEF